MDLKTAKNEGNCPICGSKGIWGWRIVWETCISESNYQPTTLIALSGFIRSYLYKEFHDVVVAIVVDVFTIFETFSHTEDELRGR